MRFHFLFVILLLCSLSTFAQFEMVEAPNRSDYGLVKTNLGVSYDREFAGVPDHITAKLSYQIIKKPYLTFSVNGHFNTLWANFDECRLSEPRDPWTIGLNGNHTYASFGFTATGFLPLFGHPVALMALGNAEWSNHCFGRISGLFAAVYLFKVTKETQIGVGPLCMIHTASKIPVFPVFIYRHKFSDQLAINIYGGLFGLEYRPWKRDMFTFGADLDCRSFYFKPHVDGWPETCRFTMTQVRPGIKYKHNIASNFYIDFAAGVAFKMSGRITSATRSRRYLGFQQSPTLFLHAGLSYSL